jgi:hypothetical protein
MISGDPRAAVCRSVTLKCWIVGPSMHSLETDGLRDERNSI